MNFPLCTIAHTPRLPEHCVEYGRVLLWPKEKPFGEETAIDGDDPAHISWIYERARERAEEYGIQGVTYRLTQGVVKHIIPAVASTNAVIAAACTTEVFKVVTSCAAPLANYMVFNDTEGIYTYVYEQEKNENCLACSRRPQKLEFPGTAKLQEVMINSSSYLYMVMFLGCGPPGQFCPIPNACARSDHLNWGEEQDPLHAVCAQHRGRHQEKLEADPDRPGPGGWKRDCGG